MVDDNKAAVSLGGVERRVNVNDDDSVEEDAAMASSSLRFKLSFHEMM